MRKQDTITMEEAIIAAKKSRPTMTYRQIAKMLGINKSTVGRALKPWVENRCPRCGRKYEDE
jgi:transposase